MRGRLVPALSISVAVSLLSLLAAAAPTPVDLTGVSADTLQKYDVFKANWSVNGRNERRVVDDLAAAPDADLCFLDALMNADYGNRIDAAAVALGKLNTQRTFDRLMTLVNPADDNQTYKVIDALGGMGRPEALQKILPFVDDAKNVLCRQSAIRALGHFKDPRAEAALIHVAEGPQPTLAADARESLAAMTSEAGLPLIRASLIASRDPSRESEHERDIEALFTYHNAAAVELLVDDLKALESSPNETNSFAREILPVRLKMMLASAEPALGALPDPHADEWADYWSRAKPLLNDDLTLKAPPQPVPAATQYTADAYATDMDHVTLRASLDKSVYRVGDPIQVRLTLRNDNAKPVRTIVPRPPSGWWPTMAYGFRLTHDGKPIFELKPSDFYIGSYSGPPRFETIAPSTSVQTAVCLQMWLQSDIDTPLAEGDYELTLSFDSSKFAMARATPPEQLHAWTLEPVRFTVKGAALQDPGEILADLSATLGLPHLERDLRSDTPARHDAAWATLRQYGDSRLAGFVDAIQPDESGRHAAPWKGSVLRPFTHAGHKPRGQ